MRPRTPTAAAAVREPGSAALARELPDPTGWSFGDYPYALEPLTLPDPGQAADGPDRLTQGEVAAAYRVLVAAVRAGSPTTTRVDRDGLERLFWFRWIVGHHISFVLWRLIDEELRRLEAGIGDQAAGTAAVTEHVRGYCGMLLYTSSCTREIYQQVIRPSMHRLHRTFSGTWAPDYRPVRALFRGRRLPPGADRADRLADQVRLSQRIHLGVAAKLVTGGRSLLQQAAAEQTVGRPHLWGRVFDCYFLTVRAPVTGPVIVAQLLRRQQAVLIDLATNGLYPAVAGGGEKAPKELRDPAVADCERDLAGTLLRTGGLAAGTEPDRVAEELAVHHTPEEER